MPDFTDKQGQYLAFIYAYTAARPPKPISSITFVSAHPRSTKWC